MYAKRCIVTGGAGFIGSALVRKLIRDTNAVVLVIDKLTYAGVPESLKEAGFNPEADIMTHLDADSFAASGRLFFFKFNG